MNILETSSSSSDDYVFIRRRKVYKRRKNYIEEFDEVNFFQRFRITKRTFTHLLDQIRDQINPATQRGGSIQPTIQLLLTLRFYATGSMQKAAADFVGVSTSSACRIIKKVSEAIALLRPHYINMYDNSREKMERSAEKFYSIAQFPRVIGAIDCTLIKIESPGGEDAEIYRCRKNFFALKVQTVSDSDLKIRDIVARWPGSSHNQTIFNNSFLKHKFEEGHFENFFLVGGSGYRLKPYLMTKLLQTQTAAENLYNESIIRTRNVVERQCDVWKRRFPCLQIGMRLSVTTIMAVIVATAVVHNMAIEENEDVPGGVVHDNKDRYNDPHGQQAQAKRQSLINEHFGRM